MLNGAEVIQTNAEHERQKDAVHKGGGQIADYNRHLQIHIDMLRTAIDETDDPKERERGRAAIRRLRQGIYGTLKK